MFKNLIKKVIKLIKKSDLKFLKKIDKFLSYIRNFLIYLLKKNYIRYNKLYSKFVINARALFKLYDCLFEISDEIIAIKKRKDTNIFYIFIFYIYLKILKFDLFFYFYVIYYFSKYIVFQERRLDFYFFIEKKIYDIYSFFFDFDIFVTREINEKCKKR